MNWNSVNNNKDYVGPECYIRLILCVVSNCKKFFTIFSFSSLHIYECYWRICLCKFFWRLTVFKTWFAILFEIKFFVEITSNLNRINRHDIVKLQIHCIFLSWVPLKGDFSKFYYHPSLVCIGKMIESAYGGKTFKLVHLTYAYIKVVIIRIGLVSEHILHWVMFTACFRLEIRYSKVYFLKFFFFIIDLTDLFILEWFQYTLI